MVTVFDWLARLFGDDSSRGDDESGNGDNSYRPSRLDASVLFAHGINSAEAAQEIANREQKEALQAQQEVIENEKLLDDQHKHR